MTEVFVLLRSRPEMFFRKPTLEVFRAFLDGYSAVNLDDVIWEKLHIFTLWLAHKYDSSPALSWTGIIGQKYGYGERGLKQFWRLWDEYEIHS